MCTRSKGNCPGSLQAGPQPGFQPDLGQASDFELLLGILRKVFFITQKEFVSY